MMNWEQLLSSKRFNDKTHEAIHDKNRSRFEQDFDRIVFSQPFRRLQDKTQVFPLPKDDFVHTRLTHSLEVSSVGRSLGREAASFLFKKYPALSDRFSTHDLGSIVASACLTHDLGNPPFGHSGEDGISSFFLSTPEGQSFKEKVSEAEWNDLATFEGNAQGFRILNSPFYKGTELTFATLGAFTKYPLSSSSKKDEWRASQKKYGFYRSNREQLKQMAETMGLKPLGVDAWSRHPLTFLVEAADDVCYSIIDLEDGCRLGLVSFEKVKDLLSAIIDDSSFEEKLQKIPSLDKKLETLRAKAIKKLINECSVVFTRQEEVILQGTFDRALTGLIPSAKVLEEINEHSIQKIYRSKLVLEKEVGGYEVIEQLMRTLCRAADRVKFSTGGAKQKSIIGLLPGAYRLQLEEEHTVYGVLQVIIDFISGLTDTHAVRFYRTVKGYDFRV